jgi:phosphoglycolate phosphatase
MTDAIRAVVFDLDGTLLDTLSDIASAMNTVLSRNGLPVHEVDAYRTMVGSGFETLARRALPAEKAPDDALVTEIAGQLREAYEAQPVVRTRPYDGVRTLLAGIAERRLPMAVLSNKADALVQRIVAEFFAPGLFAVVQGMRDDVPAKPDPTSALAIARHIGVSPPGVVYLGDSDVDMHTATNAGMRAVGAGWGFRGATELREAGAEIVIDAPLDLMGIVESGVAVQQ